MASETHKSLLVPLLEAAVRVAVRRPRAVVLLAGLLAAASVALAAGRLQFKTSRLDLLNPHSEFNRRWLAYLEEYGDGDDAVLIVVGAADRVPLALDWLCEQLSREMPSAAAVLGSPDFSKLQSGALYLGEAADAQRMLELLSSLPQQAADWQRLGAVPLLGRSLQGLQSAPQPPSVEQAYRVLDSLDRALRSPPSYRSIWDIGAQSHVGAQLPRHMLADEGRMGFVQVRIERQDGVPDNGQMELVRRAQQLARQEFPDLQVGLTGVPVLEQDEMRSSQLDMTKSSLLSLVGVAVLFAAGFGGLRLPLLTVLNLVFALCWSLGYITLAVGHLNILSVAFGAILIGLGIDFGIHLVAAYVVQRQRTDDSGAALVRAAGLVGPGIVTGALTTALAFCTAALTDFTGVAELGIIAGGGMILCMLASLLVLPALIQLADRHRRGEELAAPLPAGLLSAPARWMPRATLLATVAVTAALAFGMSHLRYDHNLLNLQPRGSESVAWERRLSEDLGKSVWYALSISDDWEQLRQRQRAFEALPSVERTESLAPLVHVPDARRDEILMQIRQWCSRRAPQPPEAPLPAVEELERLDELLQRTERLVHSRWPDLAALAAQTRSTLASLAPQQGRQRLQLFHRRLSEDLSAQLDELSQVAAASPPVLADIPPELSSRYVGRSGKHLLKVYAQGSIWDMDALRQFVRDVEAIDPQCTGHPIQTFYASRQMQRSFVHASIYSFLAVGAVLMLDFRSIRLSLLAMAPMGLGLLQLCGLLGLLGIPLNAANMIVLPLILGIGIDDGVHVVHDYLRRQGPYRLGDSTATAVLVTSATTMVGFGSMMLARHQGLRSLGQVLTLGVFCCLVTSLVLLPALLAWITRPRGELTAARRRESDAAAVARPA